MDPASSTNKERLKATISESMLTPKYHQTLAIPTIPVHILNFLQKSKFTMLKAAGALMQEVHYEASFSASDFVHAT
jgi:hypothetical protein